MDKKSREKGIDQNKSSHLEQQTKTHNNNQTTGIISAFLKKNAQAIIVSIIAAILASLLISFFTNAQKDFAENRATNKLLQNNFMEADLDYLSEALGSPKYSGKNHDFLEYVYVVDRAVLRVFVREGEESCAAYFLTSTSDNYRKRIFPPKLLMPLFNEKSLNHISFAEIDNTPTQISSVFFSTGVGRKHYIERYWYTPYYTNYHSVYLGYMDYGYFSVHYIDVKPYDYSQEYEFPDGRTEELYAPTSADILVNLNRNYANSFGMAEEDIDFIQLVTCYDVVANVERKDE